MAPSKSAWRMYCWLVARPAKMAASFAMFARSAPVRPAVRRASMREVDVGAERLRARVDAQDRLAAREVGRRDVHLPVEAAGPQQRRVEILEAVRGAHHDRRRRGRRTRRARRAAGSASGRARGGGRRPALRADGVELVDEDDRRSVLARLLEQLADAGGAEARRTSRRTRRRSTSRSSRPTRWRPPSRAASCRSRAGRRAGCPSAPARRAARSACARGGTRRPPAAPPSPRRAPATSVPGDVSSRRPCRPAPA